MKRIESLIVKYHQETVGTLALSVDGKVCTFEYDKQWLATGFSISPLELPLKPGLLLYKSGNSGGCRPKAVFSDSEGHWLVKFRHTYDPSDMGMQEYRYWLSYPKSGGCRGNVPSYGLQLLDGQQG